MKQRKSITYNEVHKLITDNNYKLNIIDNIVYYRNDVKEDPILAISEINNKIEIYIHSSSLQYIKQKINIILNNNNILTVYSIYMIKKYLCNKLWLELKENNELFKYNILVKEYKNFGEFNVLCRYVEFNNLDIKHAIIALHTKTSKFILNYINNNMKEIKKLSKIYPYIKIKLICTFAKKGLFTYLNKRQYKWIIKDIDKIQTKIKILYIKVYSGHNIITRIYFKFIPTDQIQNLINMFNWKSCTINLAFINSVPLIQEANFITYNTNIKIHFESTSFYNYTRIKVLNNPNVTVSVRNNTYKDYCIIVNKANKSIKNKDYFILYSIKNIKDSLIYLRNDIYNNNKLYVHEKLRLMSKLNKLLLLII